MRKEIQKTVVQLWPQARINTFSEYLDYIKDKYAIIWCTQSARAKDNIHDLEQRTYKKQIKFFDTNKDMQKFSRSIRHDYHTQYNIKNIYIQSYKDINCLRDLANNTFYGCNHRNENINEIGCFRHIHFDKYGE
jgi:pyruvate-formate lyase